MKVDNKTKETETGISGKKLPFLDLLLKASEDGKFLTNQDIRNETNTFMFAVQMIYFEHCVKRWTK